MKKYSFSTVVLLFSAVIVGIGRAALLSVNPTPPILAYANAAATATSYNSVSQIFSVSATPSTIQFSLSESPVNVLPARSLSIRVQVNNAGALVGSVGPGPDLVISGSVRRVVGTVTNTYTGQLLTGTITAFGYFYSGGTGANYDFRFTPTGGLLLPFYQCDHIAVTLDSENTTFTGSFASNFNGQAKGTAGLEDLTPPTITCPFDNINVTNVQCSVAGGQAGAYVTFPTPTATDNCSTNVLITCSPTNGSFFALAPATNMTSYTVTCTASDPSGNTNFCAFVVTIEDILSPEFNSNPVIDACDTAPITLNTDPGLCTATFTFPKPTATDSCCTSAVPVAVSAIDDRGFIVSLTEFTSNSIVYETGNFPQSCLGSNVITSTANDGRGNTAQAQCSVLVFDNEPPSITCSNNQTVSCTNGPVFYTEPVASDNCTNLTVSCTPPNGSLLGIGSYTVTCIASDGCGGNSNSCSFTLNVVDTTPPVISCPTNITVDCSQSTDPSSTGTATATDNCDPNPSLSYSDAISGTCPTIITRTWTATDHSGNSSQCTQMITVTDTTPPTITSVPTGSSLGCNPASLPTDASVKALVTASDNCGTPTINVSHVDSGTACAPIRTFTITAADACGNTSTPQTVVYTWTADTTVPTFTSVPTGSSLGCNPASLPTDASVKALVTATDNCTVSPTINVSHVDSGTACAPIRTFTITAADACGNVATQTVAYSWTADTIPSITCPGPVTVSCASSVPPANVGSVTASDTCGPVVVTFVGDVITNQTCPNRYTILRTYKATNPCGLSATCTQTITVNDTTKPTITCPTNITVSALSLCTNSVSATNPTIAAFLHGVTASDNCGGTATVTNNAPSSFPLGTNKVTFTATDSCGNSTTCQASVIVVLMPVNCEPIQCVPSFCQHHFDGNGNCQFATFEGNLTLPNGDQPSDFRTATSSLVAMTVTIGTNTPVVVYCKNQNPCTVQSDGCGGEAWEYFGNNNYERAICRFTDNQCYNSLIDPLLPSSSATGNRNCGALSTVSIGATSTRFYYGFQQARQPITVVCDGIVVLSVSNNIASSPFPFSQSGKTVQCTFPERLVPGNTLQWYATSDPTKVSSNCLIYTQQTSATGNSTATYYNDGGSCEIQVPTAGLHYTSNDRSVCVQVMLGQPGVSGKVGCFSFCVPLNGMGNQDWQYGQCSNFQDEFAQESDDDWGSGNW